jgi:hypothetical protein
MEYLQEIIKEQKDFDSKIHERFDSLYPTEIGKTFAKCNAMISEILEIHQELKPHWQWWRGKEDDLRGLNISNEKRQRLIEEHIDTFKFLLSSIIQLGVDTEEKFYNEYMKKHAIIHKRLEDAKNGKDNWLVFEGKRSLE